MAGVTFVLLPAANCEQGRMEFIRQSLLRIMMVFAYFLKALANHLITSDKIIQFFYYLSQNMRKLLPFKTIGGSMVMSIQRE